MAHYAFLDENNYVVEVIVGKDETEKIEGLTPEDWYGKFKGLRCIRTSYNGSIRGKYAGIGDYYDVNEDIFIIPQPYKSWIRRGSFWYAPKDCPTDGKFYEWDEGQLDWVEIG